METSGIPGIVFKTRKSKGRHIFYSWGGGGGGGGYCKIRHLVLNRQRRCEAAAQRSLMNAALAERRRPMIDPPIVDVRYL